MSEELDRTRLTKKWLRYVETKEQEIRALKQHIEELSAGPEDSDTFIIDYTHPARPLGKSPNVDFQVGSDDIAGMIHVRIEDRFGARRLYIQGGQMVRIHPTAGNAFYVELSRD